MKKVTVLSLKDGQTAIAHEDYDTNMAIFVDAFYENADQLRAMAKELMKVADEVRMDSALELIKSKETELKQHLLTLDYKLQVLVNARAEFDSVQDLVTTLKDEIKELRTNQRVCGW